MNMLAVIAIITLLVMMVITMTIRHCGVWVGIALVVTMTGVTLKHYIQVLQSSYNLCATSAIVTDDHNSDINDRDVFQIQPFAKRGNQPQN